VTLLGSVVDGHALVEVIWASLVAGIGVTIAACVAIVGGTRFADARREGDAIGAAAFGALAAVGIAAIGAAVVLGIVVMTQK
jgi:hypothetical protein